MEDRLGPARDVAEPFIDDIIVGTRVVPGGDLLTAHDKDLRRVMELLRKDSFMCNIRKCHFYRRSRFLVTHPRRVQDWDAKMQQEV